MLPKTKACYFNENGHAVTLNKFFFGKPHQILDCRQDVIYLNGSWYNLENTMYQDKVSAQSLKEIQS